MKSILKKLFATTLAIIMLFSVGNTAIIASASSAQNSVVLALDEEKTVTKGDTIGQVGSTGNSTGPHLHLEVYKDGSRIDPEGFYSNLVFSPDAGV